MKPAVIDRPWFVPVALAVLCLLSMGDVVLGLRHGILSDPTTDLATEFYYWRQFGFDNLRHGHVAQWNPAVCGGVPFFGGWQSGLFYPPNWIYLILPLSIACNLDLFISTYLIGLFTSLLARKYGLSPLARVLAGAIAMLGGSSFPHIYAGHLATLASMAWMPLALLLFDDLLDDPSPRTALQATAALSMQIFAGHPQTVFNTVVVLAIYVSLRIRSAPRPLASLGAMAAAASGSAAIAAVQLLTGIQVSTEGLRSHAVAYDFAAEISFQPIDLWTLIVPHLFGDIFHVQYWGPWNKWEECVFMGVASLPLIVLGVFRGAPRLRWLWSLMAIVLLVLAMGAYTPLFKLLYLYVPGFAKFRAMAKFIFPMTLFAAMLAGAGLDALSARLGTGQPPGGSRLAGLVGGLAFACGLGALWMANPIAGMLLVKSLRMGCDSYFSVQRPDLARFANEARRFAALGFVLAGLAAACAASLIAASRRRAWAAPALAALVLVELVAFDRSTITTFDPAHPRPASVLDWLRKNPGDHRIWLNGFLTEGAMGAGGYDVWGYDPMVQARWAQFVTRTQNGAPEFATMYVRHEIDSPALALLRCDRIFDVVGDAAQYWYLPSAAERLSANYPTTSTPIRHALPHALIVHRCRVFATPRAALEAVVARGFDQTGTVALERPPAVPTAPAAGPDDVRVAWKDCDTLRIDARCGSAGVLLITDAYSRFWHARALPGSVQRDYDPMPGDHALIAVPLRAGAHRFELTYQPPIYRASAAISLAALLVYAALWLVVRRSSPYLPSASI